MTIQSVIYRNLQQLDNKQAVVRLPALRRDTTQKLATLYDNIALYYSLINNLDRASLYSQKSVKINYSLISNSRDMGISMMRAADIANLSKRYDDAVLCQTQVLTIFENYYGRQCESKISEAEYPAQYLENADRKEESNEGYELANSLKQEMKYGLQTSRLPKNAKYTTKCVLCINLLPKSLLHQG